ncbi:MAG: ATP-dependent DNA helicase RecG [bacterium]|nr:ATP-dependent DNA helicase RecG [bacterium]
MKSPDIKLDSPLQFIKGVGPKKAELLASYGMETVRDLLLYFPRFYLDRSSVTPINKLKIDQSATIIGVVKAHGMLYGGKGRRYEAILEDDSGAIALMFFGGVHYFAKSFKKGNIYAATGRVRWYNGYQMVHPELERLEEESDKMIHAGRIIPVYPQTAELNKVGLNSRGIRRVTSFVFEHLKEEVPDYLPATELKKLRLPVLNNAIRKIHYPETAEEIEISRRRVAFDELLAFQFLVFARRRRRETVEKEHAFGKAGGTVKKFIAALPFALTEAQKKVTTEIFRDLRGKRPMNRMLQGDVGCGKTVVAVGAAVYAVENELQVAFMAPTEILAEQHHRGWERELSAIGLKSALLTSSLKPAVKKEIAEACAAGEIAVLFGTHALIYDYVQFERLGLVIIDEQHRFGVEQRSKLHAKGENPDLLVMTATPIPRTLALTLYGDLDISSIDSLPPGRLPIRTAWRSQNTVDKIYKFVIEQVAGGGQVYIIYPLIEKSEQLDLENVEDAFERLSQAEFKNLRVGMVHGRTKTRERDKTLREFREGNLDVLMSTTVIEVGIDNPNATVMLIEHAERFGLAQLHQLRGRIGRGSKKSTLIAIAHEPISDIASKRLEYFVENSDGFKIAEADLELRGPGEVFGVRQSGLPTLRAARLSSDRDLLESSRELLARLFEKTENLDSERLELYNYLKRKSEKSAVMVGGG